MPSPMQPSIPAAVFVALDLSRTSWVVALRTSGDDRVSTHKLRPGDVDRPLDLIERGRVREEQRYGGPVEVRSCYEAGYDGFWLHRRLRASGVLNVVVEPTSLLVDRRARRVKTDRIDAGTPLRALVADARGDRGVWRLVRVPTPSRRRPGGCTGSGAASSGGESRTPTASAACWRPRASSTSIRCAPIAASAWTRW